MYLCHCSNVHWGQRNDTDGQKVLYAYVIVVVRMLTHTATLKQSEIRTETKCLEYNSSSWRHTNSHIIIVQDFTSLFDKRMMCSTIELLVYPTYDKDWNWIPPVLL